MASGRKTKNNHKTVAIKDITEIIRAPVHAQSCLTLTTPQTVAGQAPLSTELSRQEYWSGLPFPSPGDPSNPGIEPRSPALQVDSLPAEPQGSPFKELLKVTLGHKCGFQIH